MAAERHEQIQPIESGDKSNMVADFGDLRQIMDGGSEARPESNLDQQTEAVMSMLSGLAEKMRALANSPMGKNLMDTIDYMADKGDPLYQLLRDGQIK